MKSENNYFKTLAQVLLTLEINTIIKADMTAVKMPSSRRRILYELAGIYHAKLTELKVRDPIYWEYAGIWSFAELRERAIEGGEEYEKKLVSAPQDEQNIVREHIKMLERIQDE